ncbi:hypothetical protein HHK36_016977 [Tetracentron sinense]|uniref:Potassium channel tetramerisation-type BTB domain-containing protein n=1 Tax=Tetracentron sinense TaxID=13715 RepID=A0A834Z3R1_TETSI|nr:hypothetical protein HHK36_016977 [Tetracentron sinense]
MFSDHPTVDQDPDKGFFFVDRDGKHFRHILNWLRDSVVPTLKDSGYSELLREAEHYRLLGLVEEINEILRKRKEDDELKTELTRTDIIKCIQFEKVRFRGVNLSGLDLSKLDLSFVDFSYACLRDVFFSRANLQSAKFRDVEAEGAIFHNATLRDTNALQNARLTGRCEFTGANLRGALLAGATLQSANLQGNLLFCILKIDLVPVLDLLNIAMRNNSCLIECSFCGADLRSAHLQSADLTNANLEGANLEGANLKSAKLSGANLQGANLQRAYLRHVDLRDTVNLPRTEPWNDLGIFSNPQVESFGRGGIGACVKYGEVDCLNDQEDLLDPPSLVLCSPEFQRVQDLSLS